MVAKRKQRVVIAVIIKDDQVISWGTNEHDDCKRIGYPTGEGYELCEGCQPHNHAEQKAIRNADESVEGAYMFLMGHTYACDSCREVAKMAGIRDIVVVDEHNVEFNHL